MRYHIFNDSYDSKPLISLSLQGLAFLVSGLLYKRWEYSLIVDSSGSSPIYECAKARHMDGSVSVDGPRMVRDAEHIAKLKKSRGLSAIIHTTWRHIRRHKQ